MDAFTLMLIAGVSDAFDGFLARRFNWQSRLGAALDPLADKLLVACVFVVFTLQGHIPIWIAIIVAGVVFLALAANTVSPPSEDEIVAMLNAEHKKRSVAAQQNASGQAAAVLWPPQAHSLCGRSASRRRVAL